MHEYSVYDNLLENAQPLNDTNYFKVFLIFRLILKAFLQKLEKENDNLKEELERKSDLINVMLNAWNVKNIQPSNSKLDSEPTKQIQTPNVKFPILFTIFFF